MYHRFLMILLLLILNINISTANSLPEINFVTEKDGQLMVRADNTFVPESTLKIRIITSITDNRYRLVAYDYIMVITDPYDNIVFIDIIKDRSRTYITESKAVFSKKIPEHWLDGEYVVEIYSYDRVNTNELDDIDFNIYDKDEEIEDLNEFFDDPGDSVLEDLGVLQSRSHSIVVKDKLSFFLDRESDPIKIQNLLVNQKVVPINSSVIVTAQVENTVPEQSNMNYQLFLNNKSINTFNLVMGPLEWIKLEYEINDPPLLENQVKMGSRTVDFTVSDTPLGPTNFVYLDIFTDKTRLYAGDVFNISVEILNTGRRGTLPVLLWLDDQELSDEVELDYGERKTISFQVSITEPGTYSAKIIGTDFSKVLFIQESLQKAQEEDVKDNSIMVIPITVYLVILTLLMLGILKYRERKP